MKYLILALVLVVPISASAQDQTSIVGIVTLSAGEAFLVLPNGDRLPASRTLGLMEGYSLETSSTGSVHVRFIDGTLVSLSCNSSMQIEQYNFTGGDDIVMRLQNGRIRLITGSSDARKVLIFTGSGSLAAHLPSTDLEVVQDSLDGFSASVYAGKVEVSNSLGSVLLEEEKEFQFSLVERNQQPVGLQYAPVGLSQRAC